MPGNIFELEQPMAPWSGRDTIRWSGGQSLQLLPLDRSFDLEPSIAELELGDGASEAEVEEVIAAYLGSGGLEETSQQLADAAESEMAGSLDSFYMVCWDAVIGEGVDSPWQFAGFLAALGILRPTSGNMTESTERPARLHAATLASRGPAVLRQRDCAANASNWACGDWGSVSCATATVPATRQTSSRCAMGS